MKTTNTTKVAALDKVLGICNALGSSYNPSEASIQPTALQALLELAREKQEAVTVTHAAYALALNHRADSFAGIPKLAAQVMRFVNVSKPKPSDREEVRNIKRRFFSVSKKKASALRAPATSDGQVPKATRTSSKLDKHSMLESFKELIQIVEGITGYNPNEMEFKVAGLKSTLAELQSSMDAVSKTSIAYREALIAREELMQHPDGVIESTKLATEYIRAKFGYNSVRSKKVTMQTSNV
jgi:hypothetical protein